MPHSFEHAIEEMVLKGNANGGVQTVDVLKALVALNRSTEAKFEQVLKEVASNREVVLEMFREHQKTNMHMTKKEFDTWVENYAMRRDEAHVRFHNKYVAELKNEEKHRHDDPDGLDLRILRGEQPDEELGDIRRIWRISRWFVLALGIAAINEAVKHIP